MGSWYCVRQGLVLGSTGCLWSSAMGTGVLGGVVNNGCRDPALQKRGLLSAPPLSAHPILMLFLLLLHPRVAQGIIPGPHLFKQMNGE